MKPLIRWDFQAQPSPGFTENGPKKRKYPGSSSSPGQRASGMPEARERPDWLQKDKMELREPPVPADGLKAAEERAGCHCCQLRTANSGYTQTRQHWATDE